MCVVKVKFNISLQLNIKISFISVYITKSLLIDIIDITKRTEIRTSLLIK